MNITEENLKAMQQLFPEAFEEGKIDFDVLRQLLGDFVDDEQERYSFKWNGKGKALRLSQTPSMGTLRPCKEESKDWDNTENLYIEGDNLEVLKLLQKSYYGKVKMIYIDPPYNTGGDFVYKDDFRDNIQNYKEVTGQIDGEGNKIDTNTENNGRFHTDWLNMMYPRLRLARNLLTDDGVIFISIDDNEQENLRRICDEIFGENNFVADLSVVNNLKGRNDKKYIARANERLFMYIKSDEFMEHGLPLADNVIKEYSLQDKNGRYRLLELRKRGGADTRQERPNMYYPFYVDVNTGEVSLEESDKFSQVALPVKSNGDDGRWRWGKETAEKRLNELFGRKVGDKYNIYEKDYLESEDGARRVRPKSVLAGAAYSTDVSTKEYRSIMGKIDFSNPKSVVLLTDLIIYATIPNENEIIMDFFSGSSTTAHAVMKSNLEENGNRRFIMIQLPELLETTTDAYKEGYKNICEIGKERIRRAGEKIKAEAGDKAADLDIGFKVFKLDSSNLQKWNPQPDDLVMTLQQATDNFLPDRTEQDVLYEIMLKMGLELTCQIEEEQAAGETVYIIGGGVLMICLGQNITTAVAEAVVKLHEEYESELWQVVFRDTGFASDMDKTNVKETLKAAGLDEDSFVCV